MDAQYQQQKLDEALVKVATLLLVLRETPRHPWIGYFERMEVSLKAGDIEEAVRARDDIPFAGMGGFGEFLEATPEIQRVYRSASELIGDLKVFSRYGIVRKN